MHEANDTFHCSYKIESNDAYGTLDSLVHSFQTVQRNIQKHVIKTLTRKYEIKKDQGHKLCKVSCNNLSVFPVLHLIKCGIWYECYIKTHCDNDTENQ